MGDRQPTPEAVEAAARAYFEKAREQTNAVLQRTMGGGDIGSWEDLSEAERDTHRERIVCALAAAGAAHPEPPHRLVADAGVEVPLTCAEAQHALDTVGAGELVEWRQKAAPLNHDDTWWVRLDDYEEAVGEIVRLRAAAHPEPPADLPEPPRRSTCERCSAALPAFVTCENCAWPNPALPDGLTAERLRGAAQWAFAKAVDIPPGPTRAAGEAIVNDLRRWADALDAASPSAPEGEPACTDLTAAWCPVHGDCRCPRSEEDERLAGGEHAYIGAADCPLHGPSSDHPSPAPSAPPAPDDAVRAEMDTLDRLKRAIRGQLPASAAMDEWMDEHGYEVARAAWEVMAARSGPSADQVRVLAERWAALAEDCMSREPRPSDVDRAMAAVFAACSAEVAALLPVDAPDPADQEDTP